ncbi:hypothetical protein ACU5DF_02795 [Aliivibrio wodanis]|uniref:hypothetical protein n=1 Tax=Aliivibrio wodanis TaxID=80852 RepID=UPI00406C03DE
MFEELEYQNRNLATHTVRLLSPLGLYPKDVLIHSDSIAYFGSDLCFILTPIDSVEIEYSEVAWLNLNEIKLLSSILLSNDQGMYLFHPHPNVHYIKLNTINVSEDCIKSVYSLFRSAFSAQDMEHEHKGNKFVTQNPYHVHSSIKLPDFDKKVNYRFIEKSINKTIQNNIYVEINILDNLLMRALATLLRSSMLMCYSYLLEEAINSTFISMDASFSLVQRKLKECGNPSPSSKDASQYISNVFDIDGPERYFQDYYERRIMAFHPSSRFGEFPHAPVVADDCYDLFDALISVYRYLICGDIRVDT